MVLALVSLVSVGSRVLWLASPRLLIFDEHYYVNAARVILGLEASPFYAKSTPGKDPNREHPPLGKLALAGSIRAFGDGPVGWRLPSVAFGSLAILAMYGLVRSVGGSRWLGVGASSLMAADTLFFVQGRVGMLDIFVLTFMLLGSALYLGGRPIPAGVVLGIGAS
ncbi:MAG: phospholipid carrier-dependent glycosyltransferase, partial [Candidatus Methylomirabilales bacterium]